MKIKGSKKNKIIAAAGIALISTVLIAVGIVGLVKSSKSESSVEVLEKSKISNLFNIKQAEGDLDDESSSSSSSSRTTSSQSRASTSSGSSTSTSTSSRAPSRTQQKSNVQSTTTSKPSSTAPVTSDVQMPSNVDSEIPTTPTTPTTPEPTPATTTPEPTPIVSDVQPPSNSGSETPAASSSATGGYTITINNSISNHIYKAYQIFTGDLHEKVLSNIEWTPKFEAYGIDIINELEAYCEEVYKEKIFENCKTAAELANILSTSERKESLASQFTKIVGDKIEKNNIETEYFATGSSSCKISGLEAGYYMVVDTNINSKDDSYSKYLLDVAGNVDMEIKAIKPSLNKKVSGGGKIDDTHNTSTCYPDGYKVDGKMPYEIKFTLEARIPTNQSEKYKEKDKEFLAEYDNYEYTIVDIVDEGFDLLENSGEKKIEFTVKKTVKGNDETSVDTVLDIPYDFAYINTGDEANLTKYNLSTDLKGSNKKVFIIALNVKELVANNKVNPGDTIKFEYNARLNGNHKTGSEPNVNEAYLIYSDNPYNKDSKSQTTNAPTYTYSIDLELLKTEKGKTDLLSGAKFEIYGSTADGKKESFIEEIQTTKDDESGKVKSAEYNSLGIGKYYITETKAPEGYNTLNEDIVLEVLCEEVKDGIPQWKIKFSSPNNLVKKVNEENLNKISLQVENTTGFVLPTTGGIGTVIFTVVGLSMMATAAIALKSNKKEM